MEYSNGTAEAYRYHGAYGDAAAAAPTSAAASAFCGNGPLSSDAFHLSATAPMVSRRFHPYGDPNGVHHGHQAAPEFAHYGAPAAHQCDQCGAVYDSPHVLVEHVQTHHPTHHFAAFPDIYPSAASSAAIHPPHHVKSDAVSETAEILDLDSHKVHVYQPPGSVGVNGGHNGNPTPPYTPATSIGSGSASNSSSMGWMTPTPPLPPPPAPTHDYRQPPIINGGHPAPTIINGGHSAPPFPSFELMSPTQQNVNGVQSAGPIKTSWKNVNNPPPPAPPPGVGGNHGGGSEARRPKTYNCESCNKWFTSSGHLKRHYNTTLHKNAVKTSGGSNGSAPVSSAATSGATVNSSRMLINDTY